MVLMAVGLNYQSAPLTLREKLVFGEQESRHLVSDLCSEGLATEAVLVSTCNRTELYCDTRGAEAALHWLAKRRCLSISDLQPYSYSYAAVLAVRHLLRVASGLDSMVLGEVEILGQIKTAYRVALEAGTLGKYLDRLFQFTFSVAKQVRTQTGIGVNPISIASIAVRLAEHIFSNLSEATVLLIGAGHLIRLSIEHLKASGVRKILLANRTPAHSHCLAKELATDETHIEILSLDAIPSRLSEADIVMTATSSVLPIVGKGMVERALKIRKHRPMYMVDLAVPRDIEPEVSSLEDVYLYSLDDLQTMANENLCLRRDAAQHAEDIIIEESKQFMGWLRSRTAFATLKSLREKYEASSKQVLSKSLQQLQLGKSPEIVLQHALHTLTNRLLHEPTRRLRQAGVYEESEILFYTRQLFDLKNETIDTH